jgi:peptidoglycan/xylan/chitin deacetylase (PgdA/CDA1 family)
MRPVSAVSPQQVWGGQSLEGQSARVVPVSGQPPASMNGGLFNNRLNTPLPMPGGIINTPLPTPGSNIASPHRPPAQPLKPVVRKRRRGVFTLTLLLVVLVVGGGLLAQFVVRPMLSTHPASQPGQSQHAQNKPTAVPTPDTHSTADQFMKTMLQKNWTDLWSMLAPDAQGLWQNEADFTNFEQAKFGKLTLQSYTLGDTTVNQSWIDPDTTYTYDSAVVSHIALFIANPAGTLTAPSLKAVNEGLFKQTLFAVIQPAGQKMWKVLVAGPADLDAPIIVPATPPVHKVILPIFMYHHISDIPTTTQLDYSLTVTSSDFSKQLDWLQAQGYHTITMTELFGMFYYGKVLPVKPMVLTFDDGYSDVYTYALPALLAHHYRGTFYIITWDIYTRYLSWDQMRTMAHDGMEIESHTVHHGNIGILSAPDLQSELVDSKSTLEAQMQAPIQFFCYPTGEPFHHDTVAQQQAVLHALYQDGYLGATLDPFTFNSALQNSSIPYQMPRIRVSGGERLDAFAGILQSTLQADVQRMNNS